MLRRSRPDNRSITRSKDLSRCDGEVNLSRRSVRSSLSVP